ncbi:MAG TPA: Gfo/Idh/MocA family oxidoreductase [Ilumatobacter sp.]|nr:Gfo/Idh/MocA family oxidoreductase [Ilumatobacter sp.]
MGERVRIGVIGTGWWATQHHLPGLLADDRVAVTALADNDPAKLTAAGEAFGVDQRFDDPYELISSGVVDGVVIAVPHAFHHRFAAAALDAGVHVLVEKPMTLTSADAFDLVSRAQSQRLHLVVGYTFQFTRHARRAREIVHGGEIGELRLVSALFSSMVESYLRGRPGDYADVFGFPITGPSASTYSDPVLSGGGQGQTQVTHLMGMAFHVTGRHATQVTAQMSEFGLAVDLADAIAFRLDDGSVGTAASTGSLPPYQTERQSIHYFGSSGTLVQDLAAGTLVLDRAGETIEVEPPLDDPSERYPTHATARGLVDLILGGHDNPGAGAAAADTVAFIEAAYRSAVDGGRPVTPATR